MVAPVGSPIFVTGSGSITVPVGALGVAVFWAYYNGTANNGINAVSLTGASTFAIQQDLVTEAGDQTATGVATAQISATGSQTLTITFDAAQTEGPIICVQFVDGINPAAWVRNSAADHAQGTGAVAATVNSQTTDLVLALAQEFQAEPTGPTGWTNLGGTVNNSEGGRLYRANTPGASTTTYTAPAPTNYSSVVLISLQDGAAAAATSLPPRKTLSQRIARLLRY